MNNNIDIVSAVFGKKGIIAYRPELREITKSVTGNILLNQIIYWWGKNNRQEFYKFKEPCKNKKYKKGDSWTEELGFSVKEFNNAIKKIGFKLGKTKNDIDEKNAIIIYRRDANGLTWYSVNWDILTICLKGIYQENTQKEDSFKMPKGNIPIYTENTTENTTEREDTPSQIFKNFLSFSSQERISLLEKKLNRNLGMEEEQEIERFVDYWTEPNKSGTKQRWELERTFDLIRRIRTWFNNMNKFNKQSYGNQPKQQSNKYAKLTRQVS